MMPCTQRSMEGLMIFLDPLFLTWNFIVSITVQNVIFMSKKKLTVVLIMINIVAYLLQ